MFCHGLLVENYPVLFSVLLLTLLVPLQQFGYRSSRRFFSKETADHSQTVSSATEEQLATIEEFASSSQSLAKLAQELTQMVNQFQV